MPLNPTPELGGISRNIDEVVINSQIPSFLSAGRKSVNKYPDSRLWNGRFAWTPELLDRLRELADAGQSGDQAGAILGCGRNAAIAKATRNGFRFHSVPARSSNRKLPTQWALRVLPPKIVHLDPSEIGKITIMGLTEQTCRWPCGDPADLAEFRYCGDEVKSGSPYCAGHHRLSYERPRSRRYAA